jgi:hypothetical protein
MRPSEAIKYMRKLVRKAGKIVKTNSWQGGKPLDVMIEVLNVTVPMDMDVDEVKECKPNLPWADIHFEERVGGKPLNPPPSHKMWGNRKLDDWYTSNEDKFSHSYPERMWPKSLMPKGIRFNTGDLQTLVDLLNKDKTTRQAFLSIWFPEDLEAALQGERVPCTIGYHFIIRDNKLHCYYFIRSCDIFRHLHNDIYFAIKLSKWIIDKLKYNDIVPGKLTFSCVSLHCFKKDLEVIK